MVAGFDFGPGFQGVIHAQQAEHARKQNGGPERPPGDRKWIVFGVLLAILIVGGLAFCLVR